MLELTDIRGELLRLNEPPRRIVSLVPSDTFTMVRLGVGTRLVGRTRYCVEPAAEVAGIPHVGGTKDPDIDAIIALEPDLVIANQEENTKRDIVKLQHAGIRIFVSFPKRVEEGVAHIARLSRILGTLGESQKALVRMAYQTQREAEALRKNRTPLRAFVPIWMDPLMTIHGDTFLSDQLDLAGASNVFAERRRRYPLAADFGERPPLSAERVGDRDTRYPRVTLDEVRALAPEIVLLPDEPHEFTEADRGVFRALDIPAAKNGRIHFCNGRDLMWPGLRGIEGLSRLTQLIAGDSSKND